MIVTIHQPDFLPWLGFFDRWKNSDLFIILDDVQFIRRGWQHRDKIKTPQGVKWFTVPVKKKGRYEQKVNEVEIEPNSNWPDISLNAIRHSYLKAPNFHTHFPTLEKIFTNGHQRLVSLNLELLRYCANVLQISTPIQLSSTLGVTTSRTERLLQLVQAVGGTVYYTGQGSKGYLDEDMFHEFGVQVQWHDFIEKPYPQLYGDFAGMLSVVDYLMMDGRPEILQ